MPRVTPSDRRERILDAAREAFAERGFAGTRLEDVARRVGISRSALYLMFDSKEAVFRALVHALVGEVLPVGLPENLGNVPAPYALRGFLRAAFIRLTRPDLAFLPRLIVGEGQQFPDLVRTYHDEGITRVLGVIERIIRHGAARGEFHCPDPELAARTVAGGVIMTALWKNVFEPAGAPEIDVDRMAATHADLILDGLCVREGARP
ncbi:TetR/AcrR family transcriptional regulator [Novosphingobium sp. KCTC 2891]|uniref:TetR/AcrR family transcriptional regulator n=1 Tax=Novosphingobium sp. KCTC 2891 TaxID=2989730 RepID=UPI00222309B2|nr:TetR/AcrR family transcriptional regulator [Novosphingobium sp. KCTC 2891]MCW1382790.1 TetR/AcrR family transcriptional regulator [Novosphingobium sp. KCTC 2891]